MSKNVFKLAIVLAITIPLLSACTLPWAKKKAPVISGQTVSSSPVTASSSAVVYTNQLKKFLSYQELAQFLSDNSNPNNDAAVSNSLNVSASSTAGNYLGAPALGASATSTKSDIVATDGNYVYALDQKGLAIIKVSSVADAAVVSRVTFKSRPTALFLTGNFLAVYGQDTQYDFPYTFFKVFDVSDPLNPKPVRDLDFAGSLAAARLAGNYVYFLVNTSSGALPSGAIIPPVLDNGQTLATQCDGSAECYAPTVYYLDSPYDSYHFADLVAINILNNSEALSGQLYLLNNYQNLYLQADNLYLAYSPTVNIAAVTRDVERTVISPKLSASDQDLIAKIEATPANVLNRYEKSFKTAAIINNYLDSLSAADKKTATDAVAAALPSALASAATADTGQTLIYKLGLNGNTFSYEAQGEIKGHILGPSAVDENGDYLRLATALALPANSVSGTAPTDFYSNIYVLGPDLKAVGSLLNLDTTSPISAVRFMGNRVYMMTASASDPLYVINLNDPTKPAVLGAVRVPGSNYYLEPLDINGQAFASLDWDNSATSTSGVASSSLKLSIFDFSNLSQPKETSSYIIGDAQSGSIALADHQALFYSPDKKLLAIPAAWQNSNGSLAFAGTLVFSAAGNQLKLQEQIDHSAGGHFGQADAWNGINYYDNSVKRSFLLNDDLATFSDKFLRFDSTSDWKEVKSVELTTVGDDYMITSASVNCAATSTAPVSFSTPPTVPDSSSTSTPSVSTSTPSVSTSTPPLK